MKEDNGGYPVTIKPAESLDRCLSATIDDPNTTNAMKSPHHENTSCESPFFSYRTKDKISTLFRNKIVFGLSALAEILYPMRHPNR
jgi:hypothetical protein